MSRIGELFVGRLTQEAASRINNDPSMKMPIRDSLTVVVSDNGHGELMIVGTDRKATQISITRDDIECRMLLPVRSVLFALSHVE